MRILLIGGGSGGHITPLLAVARELKQLDPAVELIGVCEKRSKFVGLFQDDANIDRVFQVSAGKYRRYAGLKWYQRWFDVKTLMLNTRDVWRLYVGYIEAKRLLKELKPDMLFFKGGFVAVPVGKAAAKLGIPYVTHDSDSVPGLANRLIAKSAKRHATGMPIDMYDYPAETAIYTGIPVSEKYKRLNSSLKATYRDALGLSSCSYVITVTGGSQGGEQLNNDVVVAVKSLVQKFPGLGVVHIAGSAKEKTVREAYAKALSADQLRMVVIKGFTNELEVCTGAADVVVSRASATTLAELSLQAQAVVVVPGRLSGGHQDKNAAYLEKKAAAALVQYGDAAGLESTLADLLSAPGKRASLAENLRRLAKPQAAKDIASLLIGLTGTK